MKIGILGTGTVGETLGTALAARGHDVTMGSRSAGNEKAVAWAAKVGARASHGTFADAAAAGELVILCTAGGGAVEAARAAGAALDGKVLIDVTNPLDFAKGFPPSLFFRGDDSLGEQVQRAVPGARVVKALNTISASVMIDPGKVAGGEHDLFVAGNDAAAKATVRELLTGWFGWKHFVDLGDITGARATESYLAFWVRLYGALKSPEFSVKVVR
jgi:8-hydroxy-5-deazaflavin:NADPH oxidoreductase